MIQIFNVQLFGSDADWFCNLSVTEQISWIKSNTNQVNDTFINQFLSNSLHNKKDYCFTCRDNKQRVTIAKIVEDGNISEGNAEEVKAVVEPTASKKPRKHRNN
jgi:hypothetical protein